jgi:Transposase DDE domain
MKSKQICQMLQIKEKREYLLSQSETLLSRMFRSKYFQWILNDHGFFREGPYSALKVTLLFMKQILTADKSCKNVVDGFVAEQLIKTGRVMSTNTGSYVKGRQRLPEQIIHEAVKEVGQLQQSKALPRWKPYGRELKVFDGTTVKMADTEANRERYPKHSNQKQAVGFPLARLVVVMSLVTGCVVDYALGACKGKGTGEASLLRQIMDCIVPNDIVLGDRYYPHFFLMCDLIKKGVDGIFRAPAQRRYDFRQGIRLGK